MKDWMQMNWHNAKHNNDKTLFYIMHMNFYNYSRIYILRDMTEPTKT